MSLLRYPDDEKAEASFHRAARQAFVAKPQRLGDCPRCGTLETLMLRPLCHMCDTAQRDAQTSRALCDFIHRGRT